MGDEIFSPQKANEVAVQSAIDSAKIQAGMSKDISYLVKSVDSLNIKMDNLPNAYVGIRDFTTLQSSQNTTDKKVETLQRIVWLATGGLSVLIFVLKFFFK